MDHNRKIVLASDLRTIYPQLNEFLEEDKPRAYKPNREGNTMESAALDGVYAAGYEKALDRLRELAELRQKTTEE